MEPEPRKRLGISEVFGLRPYAKTFREVIFAFRGDPLTPGTRFGPSSLRIFKPWLALKTWLGIRRSDRRIPLCNLFNRTQTDIAEGWSVRVTQAQDFRGGKNTYDSHNGTDFAVPVGTVVTSAAPGRVFRVSSEFNRGGLKVFIDHGEGLVTTYNHLARALVKVGDIVKRGQAVALSGASGMDLLLLFPWNCPHVHFNVWLNGQGVDPFARQGEVSLWRSFNDPKPAKEGTALEAVASPTRWNLNAVEQAIASCRKLDLRAELAAIKDSDARAYATLFYLNYFPLPFAERPILYAQEFPRAARLDLPFRAQDFSGVCMP